jgi:hypothetical protein
MWYFSSGTTVSNCTNVFTDYNYWNSLISRIRLIKIKLYCIRTQFFSFAVVAGDFKVNIWMWYFSSGTTVSNCTFFTFTNQTKTSNHPTIYQFINIRCMFTHNIYKLTFWKNRIIFSTDKMFCFKRMYNWIQWCHLKNTTFIYIPSSWKPYPKICVYIFEVQKIYPFIYYSVIGDPFIYYSVIHLVVIITDDRSSVNVGIMIIPLEIVTDFHH